jgi:hypothetical protein
MAGEWPQETGQCLGSDRVSLERHDEARLERENQVRKRQQVLTLSGGNGKRKSTDTALVRRQMKEGKTLDAIKAAGVPDKLAPWKTGFLKASQWLELVYRSLEKGAGR